MLAQLLIVDQMAYKGGADQPRLLSQPSLFGNYVPRSHHEGAACINLRSRTKNLLIRRRVNHCATKADIYIDKGCNMVSFDK